MPDYKYKGEVFSEEEIIEAAEKKGVSFEDYTTEFDIIKIDDTVKPPATESSSVDISLDSLKTDVKTGTVANTVKEKKEEENIDDKEQIKSSNRKEEEVANILGRTSFAQEDNQQERFAGSQLLNSYLQENNLKLIEQNIGDGKAIMGVGGPSKAERDFPKDGEDRGLSLNYGEDFDTDANIEQVNMNVVRDIHIRNITKKEIKNRSSDPNLIQTTLEDGKKFLGESDNELIDLQLRYDNTSGEEKNKIGVKIDELVNQENYGGKLYDPYTGKLVNYKDANEDTLSVYEQAQEKAQLTPVDKLKSELNNSYSKVVALSKDINTYIDEVGDNEFGMNLFSTSIRPEVRAIGALRNLFGADDTYEDDLRIIKETAETGKIPENISKLPGTHPYSIAFNEALEDYLVVNRAVQINRNPITSERESGAMEFYQAMVDKVGGESATRTPITKRDEIRSFIGAMNATGQEYIDPNFVNERLKSNISQMIGSGTPDLIEFAAKIVVHKSATAGFAKGAKGIMALGKESVITKGINRVSELAKKSKYIKSSPIAKNGVDVITKAVDEVAVFTGAEAAFGDPSPEEQMATAKFAWFLGIGGGIAPKLLKMIPAKTIFSPAVMRLNKFETSRNWLPSLTSAGTGAISFELASAMTDFEGFTMNYNEDGTVTAKTAAEIIKHTVAETGKMLLLGKASSFHQSGMVRALRNDLRTMRGISSVEVSSAGKNVGFTDLKRVENPDETIMTDLNAAKSKKINEINKNIDENNITKEQGLKEINDVNDNFLILEAQAELGLFKQQMKAEEKGGNARQSTEMDIHVLLNRIKKGETLTEKDNYTLFDTPLPILYKTLGLKTGETSSSIDQIIAIKQRATIINDILDKNEKFATPVDTKIREEAYDFINESFNVGGELEQLKRKKKKDVSDEERLKELEAQYKELNPGGIKYEAIQNKINDFTEKAIEQDVKFSQDIVDATKEGKLETIGSKDSFQKLHDEIIGDKTNVKEDLGFYNPTTKEFYLNKQRALEVKNITTATHETGHFILRDSLKDNNGFVTDAGIKVIDDVLNQLTPKQRKIVDDRVENQYKYDKDGNELAKNEYYEEYLVILSEAIKNNQIQFSENIGNSLNKFIPFMKKEGLENLEMNTESGKNLFNLIKSYSKGEAKGIEAAKKLSKEAEGKKGKGTKSVMAKSTLFEGIQELVPSTIKTEKEYNKYINSPDGVKLFNSIILPTGAIQRYVRDNQTSQEQGDKTLQNIQDRILKFNPQATRKTDGKVVGIEAFTERVMSDAMFGKMDANKSLAKESERASKEESIDNPDVNTQLADDVNIDSKIDNTPKQQTSKLRRDLNIKQGDDVYNAIKKRSKEIFGKEIPNTKILAFINKAAKEGKELSEIISKEMSKEKAIDEQFKNQKLLKILDNISIQDKVKIERLAKEGKFLTEKIKDRANAADVDRLTGKKDGFPQGTSRTSGPSIYKSLPITLDQAKKIFTQKRKAALLGVVAENLIKQSAPEVTQELVKEGKMTESVRAEILNQLRQPQNLKFSKGSGNSVLDKNSGLNVIKDLPLKEQNKLRKDFLINTFVKYLPEELIRATNFSPGNSLSSVEKRNFNYITDVTKIKDKVEREKAKKMIEAGKLIDLASVKKYVSADAKEFSKEDLDLIKEAYRGKKGEGWIKNAKNREQHNKGVGLILDALNDMVAKEGQQVLPFIREFLYNANLNSNAFRNAATAIGQEKNVEFRNKTSTDEHVFPAIENALALVKILGIKNKKIRDDSLDYYKEWTKENYIQIALKNTSDIAKGNQRADVSIDGTKKELNWVNAGGTSHPLLIERLNKAIESGKKEDWDNVPSSDLRYFNEFFHLNPNNIEIAKDVKGEIVKETYAKKYNVEVEKKYTQNENVVGEQSKLISQQIVGIITAKQAQARINEYVKLADGITKAGVVNNKLQPKTLQYSNKTENKTVLNDMNNIDKASRNARDPNAKEKGISVWDFDDTLALTKSNVLYELPNGKKGKISATEFAKRSGELEKQGAIFDFSEFSKVTKGKKGPMFDKAIARNKKFGNENVFILTARPDASSQPIHSFLKALGLDIPLKNIVGLENGNPQAKARWMVEKAAEGYNDFYFADDAYKNVKAVNDALSVFDVKSKTRQAFVRYSKTEDLDKEFNKIIENKTGISVEKEYSKVKATLVGENKGKLDFFIPPSAEDFMGLLYKTLGKGKLGDSQMAWYKDNLTKPFARAMDDITRATASSMNDFKALKKQLKIIPKNLKKKVPGERFTQEQAVRTYIWNKQGMNIPGMSKAALKDLNNFIENNPDLITFADQLIAMQKGDQYAAPVEGWLAGNITTDLMEGISTIKRAKYLEEWQRNSDVIFSEKNLNKLEAAYGKSYRVALENSLQRMKTGKNRSFGGDTMTGRVTDWLTNSVGAIMFFNTRSAVLQTLSAINFVNFSDNNIYAAGKAFANQKQYWKDFKTLFNSDFLVQRRDGLKLNVNEADIAEMAKKGGPKGVISELLRLGFLPTQIADSFAIAAGGSTFYRNRLKALEKQGMSKTEAETQAFQDFRETAEESQQSSRPDRISMQQAGPLGRIILAFANTPAQYTRIMKKAASDLKNGRGDAKTNVSKILYYGFAQNLMFNALQQALFAVGFGDEEEEESKEKRYINVANGMADSVLRGAGIGGAIFSVLKNTALRLNQESDKKSPKYQDVLVKELAQISPPISSKLSKLKAAGRSYSWNKKEMMTMGWSLDNPAYLAAGQLIAATTNIPLDRAFKKIDNIRNASNSDLEAWQRIASAAGWSAWELGIEKPKQIKKSSRGKKRKTSTRGSGRKTIIRK